VQYNLIFVFLNAERQKKHNTYFKNRIFNVSSTSCFQVAVFFVPGGEAGCLRLLGDFHRALATASM
jgi:hypothetical protein